MATKERLQVRLSYVSFPGSVKALEKLLEAHLVPLHKAKEPDFQVSNFLFVRNYGANEANHQLFGIIWVWTLQNWPVLVLSEKRVRVGSEICQLQGFASHVTVIEFAWLLICLVKSRIGDPSIGTLGRHDGTQAHALAQRGELLFCLLLSRPHCRVHGALLSQRRVSAIKVMVLWLSEWCA